MDLVIYGAQGIALGAYEAIHNIYPAKNIHCFLVTERGDNAEILAGIPVLELEFFSASLSGEEKKAVEILIATPENIMQEIEDNLDAHGFSCHVRLTSLRWAQLMGYYYAGGRKYMPLQALPVGHHRAEVQVFMAKFYKDKPLSGCYVLPKWVFPLQVGAALCKERVAGILDCEGENISAKNENYSELTALYWMWKNRLADCSFGRRYEYYGLAHYRRMLELTEDDMLRLVANEVDVILPYPMPYEPDISAHHKRYLKDADWNALLAALEELHPEYAGAFAEVLRQKYLYNYNIILARKEVLKDYCGWLFPVLERVEQLSMPRGWERKDRYIGYMGETLETLYFMKNADRLHVAHAGCRLLI